MAKLGPQDYALVGSQGVALTVYALRRLGFQAMEASEGLPFDVMSYRNGKLIRIQTKTTQSIRSGTRYSFITAKGRYANKNSHSTVLTQYTRSEVDLIACAALPLDKVLFVPITKISSERIYLDETEFTKDGATEKSFLKGLKELRLV